MCGLFLFEQVQQSCFFCVFLLTWCSNFYWITRWHLRISISIWVVPKNGVFPFFAKISFSFSRPCIWRDFLVLPHFPFTRNDWSDIFRGNTPGVFYFTWTYMSLIVHYPIIRDLSSCLRHSLYWIHGLILCCRSLHTNVKQSLTWTWFNFILSCTSTWFFVKISKMCESWWRLSPFDCMKRYPCHHKKFVVVTPRMWKRFNRLFLFACLPFFHVGIICKRRNAVSAIYNSFCG